MSSHYPPNPPPQHHYAPLHTPSIPPPSPQYQHQHQHHQQYQQHSQPPHHDRHLSQSQTPISPLDTTPRPMHTNGHQGRGGEVLLQPAPGSGAGEEPPVPAEKYKRVKKRYYDLVEAQREATENMHRMRTNIRRLKEEKIALLDRITELESERRTSPSSTAATGRANAFPSGRAPPHPSPSSLTRDPAFAHLAAALSEPLSPPPQRRNSIGNGNGNYSHNHNHAYVHPTPPVRAREGLSDDEITLRGIPAAAPPKFPLRPVQTWEDSPSQSHSHSHPYPHSHPHYPSHSHSQHFPPPPPPPPAPAPQPTPHSHSLPQLPPTTRRTSRKRPRSPTMSPPLGSRAYSKKYKATGGVAPKDMMGPMREQWEADQLAAGVDPRTFPPPVKTSNGYPPGYTDPRISTSPPSPPLIQSSLPPLTLPPRNDRGQFRIAHIPRIHDGTNRPAIPPGGLPIGLFKLQSLGIIKDLNRAGYSNKLHIFPVGLQVTRKYLSMKDPRKDAIYTCSIHEGPHGPLFRVVASDFPDQPSVADTPSAAWAPVVKASGAIRERELARVRGSEFFGLGSLVIKHLIQELPGARQASHYRWIDIVEDPPGTPLDNGIVAPNGGLPAYLHELYFEDGIALPSEDVEMRSWDSRPASGQKQQQQPPQQQQQQQQQQQRTQQQEYRSSSNNGHLSHSHSHSPYQQRPPIPPPSAPPSPEIFYPLQARPASRYSPRNQQHQFQSENPQPQTRPHTQQYDNRMPPPPPPQSRPSSQSQPRRSSQSHPTPPAQPQPQIPHKFANIMNMDNSPPTPPRPPPPDQRGSVKHIWNVDSQPPQQVFRPLTPPRPGSHPGPGSQSHPEPPRESSSGGRTVAWQEPERQWGMPPSQPQPPPAQPQQPPQAQAVRRLGEFYGPPRPDPQPLREVHLPPPHLPRVDPNLPESRQTFQSIPGLEDLEREAAEREKRERKVPQFERQTLRHAPNAEDRAQEARKREQLPLAARERGVIRGETRQDRIAQEARLRDEAIAAEPHLREEASIRELAQRGSSYPNLVQQQSGDSVLHPPSGFWPEQERCSREEARWQDSDQASPQQPGLVHLQSAFGALRSPSATPRPAVQHLWPDASTPNGRDRDDRDRKARERETREQETREREMLDRLV